MISDRNHLTSEQQAFIDGSKEAVQKEAALKERKTVPVMLRVDSYMLARIDRAAKRLGLKRQAFLVSSAAERVERLERD